jgi:glycine/D-amino acid oxidase-like deaminating enzyme
MSLNSKNSEYTIVGAGLAGTVLAWQFLKRNIPFSLIDAGENQSTTTAAGVVNPIVFKRLTKSWKADELLPYAGGFYTELEDKLGIELLLRKNLLRIFASVEEENNWSVKEGDDRFTTYLDRPDNLEITGVNQQYGAGLVKTIGHLKTTIFLEESHRYFQSLGYLVEKRSFDYDEVDANKQYIFCEGVAVQNNPYFTFLPLKPTHGEVLIIRSTTLKVNHIVNGNMFIQPLENDLFKLGATYNWELNEPICTEEGKADLLERFEQFVDCEYEVVDQLAGIRPTVKDRRPLIGSHPQKENLHVFNGMGTKGVMIAPFFANQFADALLGVAPLDKEVDIRRFWTE